MKPQLIALCGPVKGLLFRIVELCDVRIGRGKNSHIRLDDPRVAIRHCLIIFEYGRCVIFAQDSLSATFVNDFSRAGKVLVHGDRIKIGMSIFLFSDRDDVDPALLELTEAEKNWYRTITMGHYPAHEAATETVLDAFLNTLATVNELRSSEDVQAEILELILAVIPADRAAILLAGHDQDRFVSTAYRSRSQTADAFPIDDETALEVLREGSPIYQEKIACCPITVPTGKVGVTYAEIDKSAWEDLTAGHAKLLETIASFSAVTLEHARYVQWLERENQRLNQIINVEHGMTGQSEKMLQAYDFVNRAGPSERTILITGETGTGKELLARALHRNSPRRDRGFFALNCAAIPESLLESELFGHEKGSFTGAMTPRKGLFELADGGTVFLDEIGEMPLHLQPKLLRVLQEGEVKRLGSNSTTKVNVRIIAATNRDLKQESEAGRFRPDLYFRLNVLSFEMPRLTDRREDIPLLAAYFIKKHRDARASEYPAVLGISPEAHELLAAYNWRGNVRELEHVIERAIAMGTSPYIVPEDLPPELRPSTSGLGETGIYDREKPIWEKGLFQRVLAQCGGNKPEAARRLGFSVKYFYDRCKELGL